MKVKTEEIIRKVLLLTGEDPTIMCDAGECAYATLADRIEADIEAKAAEAVMATPRELLDGWQPLHADGLASMEDGSALLPLPDNFLRLASLRLAGWLRNVTDIHLPDTLTAKMQSCGCAALRGSTSRPVAVMTATAAGRALRLYGRHANPPSLEEAWYIATPRISADGFIDIPGASFPALLKLLADGL